MRLFLLVSTSLLLGIGLSFPACLSAQSNAFGAGKVVETEIENINTIADAKAKGPGQGVRVKNVTITSLTDHFSTPGFISLRVEDETGALTIFGGDALAQQISGLSTGDVVTISGVTNSFQGLFLINSLVSDPIPFSISKRLATNGPVQPTEVLAEDFRSYTILGEVHESRLVLLNDVSFLPDGPSGLGQPFLGESNYTVTDGVDEVDIRISTHEIAASLGNVPEEPVQLIGVFDQFTFAMQPFAGYQLQLTKILPVDSRLHYCDVAEVCRGVPVSGGVHQTQASDDRDFVLNPGFTLSELEAPVTLVFTSTLSGAPTELMLNLEASVNTPGLKRIVEIYNSESNQFYAVLGEAASFDADFVSTIDVSHNIGNFVEPKTNQVVARVNWKVVGFTIVSPWEVMIDDIHWQTR